MTDINNECKQSKISCVNCEHSVKQKDVVCILYYCRLHTMFLYIDCADDCGHFKQKV